MRQFVVLILLSLFPTLILADSTSLSFAPPASDYSVVFLGNMFGIVDGVLHGTGSQIMGVMFGVFNSAVLALGGMIIMYTLMVSTMNTAHEGQMLGQKWSSIWIPVRSTMGLALLIPKASGYCLMQIFVMWIVVQGVGAADKIWEAALGYLNRGGVIIQAQVANNPTDALLASQRESEEMTGAKVILVGQVCMLGLQKQLEAQRQTYLDQSSNIKNGPCSKGINKIFCQSSIPDFIGSVNAVTIQNANKDASSFVVNMPNLESTSPYAFLNGICGHINWNKIVFNQMFTQKDNADGTITSSTSTYNVVAPGMNQSAVETTKMSRAIAIQQMYLDLSKVARVMVNNSPQLTGYSAKATTDVSSVAKQQFGVPYTKNGAICTQVDFNGPNGCTTWGSATLPHPAGILFNGTEFQGATLDYQGIMMPTLRLMRQSSTLKNEVKSREFINDANSKGWIMAGSYFFDLVRLNGNAVANAEQLRDTMTGLNESNSDPATELLSPFSAPGSGSGCIANKYTLLCTWLDGARDKMSHVISLINSSGNTASGSTAGSGAILPEPNLKPDLNRRVIDGIQSSTVYGFINNSVMMQLPGQPGLKPMEFPKFMSFTVDTKSLKLEWMDFACGGVTIIFFKFCLGWMFGNLFYNVMFLTLYNTLIAVFAQIVNQVVVALLMVPLTGMSMIFKQGIMTLSAPGVNPVVALANMGTQYINFAGNLWLMLLGMAATPIIGVIIFPLIILAMPLLLAWVGIMVGIGFTTAYYIPILPYMIFTFGSIGWLICVVEAMVAAPLVALGVTHPEGHDAFGKGEAAIMILMNVFLRPAMMIIGYIAAIALSYVGVWILNAGYDHAISFMQGGDLQSGPVVAGDKVVETVNPIKAADAAFAAGADKGTTRGELSRAWDATSAFFSPVKQEQGSGSGETKYTEWAGIYAFFFSILIYTTMYLIIVQKAFGLITQLPDKVLRWIGGSPESVGGEAAQWGEEVKKAGGEAGEKSQAAQAQVDKQLGATGQKAVGGAKSAAGSIGGGGGDVGASGGEATPDGGDGGGGGGSDGPSKEDAAKLAML